MLAIFWFIPFTIDRLIYPKFKNHKVLSTLTFPVVTTALFFLLTLDGPFDDGSGTTNSYGYVYESLAFSQIRSVFGIWVLIFIHSWLNAIINFCWDHKFKWNKIKNLVIIYPSIILAIFIFGFAKININSTKTAETVKIALAVLVPEDGKPVLMSKFFDSRITSPFEQTISRISQLVNDAANDNAKIISFQEFAILIYEEEQEKLKTELQTIAQEYHIYLSLTYAYFAKEGKGENIQLLIDPDGIIQLDYAKRYLLGLGDHGETGVFRKGAEVIQYHDTPFGRIGLSICRDAGFPKYMRQAAKANVDIMLSPSYDWPKSYSAWYITAPLENGFSFVRPTYNGYSYAADYHGSEINHMTMDESSTGLLYSEVPVKGITTIYGKIGDVFGWISLFSFILLLVFNPLRKK